MSSDLHRHAYLRRELGVLSAFIRKNIVMLIAALAAVVTMFFVPPDEAYLDYFDFKTLTCLFCVLAVVCALKNISFFYLLARKCVELFKNARLCVLGIVYITFIGSMLIANDMALLTFLPLGFFVLTATDKRKYMIFTFIMQNIAANLGGMLTPFGNPQNLFLYSKFNIPTGEFMSIMLPPFLLSIALMTLACFLFVPADPIRIADEKVKLSPARTVVYLLLFAFSILIVFRAVPYILGLVLIPLSLLFLDRKALYEVDYALLFTFVFFFVFAGNMARIEGVRGLLSGLLENNTLIASVLSCQVISNVPSAILLSQFTENYRALLLGVNIGGVGTLISSLASLITFRRFRKYQPENTGKYLLTFTAFNFAFLILLTTLCLFL